MAKDGNAIKYLPSQKEIADRLEAQNWMMIMGWPPYLIDAIFYDELPDLLAVRRMVYKFGPDAAKRKLILMMENE